MESVKTLSRSHPILNDLVAFIYVIQMVVRDNKYTHLEARPAAGTLW